MLDRIPEIFKNFYVLLGIVFVVWMLFFDSNDLFSQISKTRKYNALKKEKDYYEEHIREGERALEELRTDEKKLEKFARENYFMKKWDEEVFIVVDKEKK